MFWTKDKKKCDWLLAPVFWQFHLSEMKFQIIKLNNEVISLN